jgi:hypothetical protein
MITFKYPHSIAINLNAAMGILASGNHQEIMDDGYATTIVDPGKDDYFLMGFQNVDDHRDGNGMSTVVIISGAGTFYLDGAPLSVQAHDVIHFSDHIEHGFSSDERCLAVVITWDKHKPTHSEIISRIEQRLLDLNQIL